MSKRNHDPDPGEDLSPEETITSPEEKKSKSTDPTSSSITPKHRSAFAILMASAKISNPTNAPARPATAYSGRRGLLAYQIDNPDLESRKRILWTTDECVAIKDKFPKSTIHFLLLPKDPTRRSTRSKDSPVQAFSRNDLPGASDLHAFLEPVRRDVERLKETAAEELERLYGAKSASSAARQKAIAEGKSGAQLPAGRDWASELRVGVHVVPSMDHLHIHVLSPDMNSETLGKKSHYMSHTTGFLVPFDDFPIKDWVEREKTAKDELHESMECWRCGRAFGGQSKFAFLKAHLKDEFEAWIRE